MQSIRGCWWAIALLGFAWCGGCAAPARTGEPTAQTFAVADDAQRETLWEAIQDVLRARRFALDRVDRRAGVLNTHPVTTQYCFEAWRRDVATAYDFWEATLRTVRRSAEIGIAYDEQAGAATVTVAVHRERLASPERQYNNSIAAFRMFSDTLPAEATGQRLTPADDYWIEDGRDLALERALLDQIIAYAGG